MVLKNLDQSQTATNNSLPLGGTASAIFGGTGEWDATANTLKLTVAAGQKITNHQTYTVSFTMQNPSDNTAGASGDQMKIDGWDEYGIKRLSNHNVSSYVFKLT